MRAKQVLSWVLILSLASLAMVSQTARSVSAASTIAALPAAQLPQAYQYRSGIFVTASIGAACGWTSWNLPGCAQPYTGEFVVTELNGAEVARVLTNYQGQAMVDLSPGRYVVGVRTENYYPYAAPLIVNVLPGRYAYVSFWLDSGQPRQAPSW
jgi:hypothetical protein